MLINQVYEVFNFILGEPKIPNLPRPLLIGLKNLSGSFSADRIPK
jgi:hypothetical protein